MKQKIALVFHYSKVSRYSVHALAGALETRSRFDDMPIDFIPHHEPMPRAVAERIESGHRTVAAISFTTAAREETRRLAERIRDAVPDDARSDLLLLAGGPHPSGETTNALELGFDAVVVGEGERAFIELMERWDENRDWRPTPGVAHRDAASGQTRLTPPGPPVDLDDYPPFPARRRKFGHIEITRGCPFHCAFCQVSRLHGGRPRHRSLEAVLRAVRVMRQDGRRDFRFITPNAFGYGSPDGRIPRINAVADLLSGVRREVGPDARVYFGSFPSEARPEHILPETVALVRRYADNDNLVVGAQSGSDRILRACGRGHDVNEVRRAARCIIEGGLRANVDFIFGLPGETERDCEETIALMEELADWGARIHTHTFMPFPKTSFANAPAGHAPERVRELLRKRLTPSGEAYGNWLEQEALARSIASSAISGKGEREYEGVDAMNESGDK